MVLFRKRTATDKSKSSKRRFITKLRNKYKISFYNEITYDEVFTLRLSRLNVAVISCLLGTILVVFTILLLIYTPLIYLIPGYPSSETKINMVRNVMRMDSLERQIQAWTVYNEDLKLVLAGKQPLLSEELSDTALVALYKKIELKKSMEDSLFRRTIEDLERLNLSNASSPFQNEDIENKEFSTPFRGRVKDKIDVAKGKFYSSFELSSSETVFAILEGSVLLVETALNNTLTVIIQHADQVTSIYRGLGDIKVDVGSRVIGGQPIGNAQEIATQKKHIIQFELWFRGKVVDPLKYIKF